MSKLDELIKKYCPNGTEYKRIEELCDILDSKRKPVSKEKRIKGKYPYYGANGIQDYINDYLFDGTFLLIGEDGSVINKDKSPVLNWVTGKIWVNNHAHILKSKDICLLRYIYYVLQTIDISMMVRGTPPKLNQFSLKCMRIPVPPLPVQEEIVRILDSFTKFNEELIKELTKELINRKKQYEYYRDKLLNFNNNIPQIKLKDCILDTQNIKTNDILNKIYIDLSSVDRLDHKIKNTSIINFNNAPSRAKQIVYKDDILFATTRPMLKRYCIVNEAFDNQICSTGFCILRADKNKVLPKWIYYSIGTTSFFEFIQLYQKGSSYPAITNTEVKEYKIFLPSLDEQKFIISILDKFDTLCNDLTIDLPAEIETRKKQYEYYRDKLLTFKELKQ